jgi:signal transduction histidine kinase
MTLSSILLIAIGYLVHRLFSFIVKAEARALRLAHMEAMASLAGGVAHELRNPLSIIRMMCEEILAEQHPDSRSARNARDIIGEVDRLNELVHQFLSLAKPPDLSNAQPVDLVAEVRRTAELLRKSSPKPFALELNLPAVPLHVQADERALRQVILNLLLNARDAVAENGGRISVTVAERRDMAEVRIADTGPGIAQRDLERVFDPFFTTKPTGSGLGLAISRSLVQNMGGEISLTSTLGKGTEVSVRLPLRRSVTLRD